MCDYHTLEDIGILKGRRFRDSCPCDTSGLTEIQEVGSLVIEA
jgi:hypothetical protein